MKTIAWFLLIIFLPSCTTYRIKEFYQPFDGANSCKNPSKQLYLFFEGEQHPSDYKHLGFVDVEGHIFASEKEVMMRLQYLAQSKCANGIINVRVTKEKADSNVLYIAEGMAVKFHESDELKVQYASYSVSGFEREARAFKRDERITAVFNTIGNVILITGLVVIAVLLETIEEEEDTD